MTNEEVGAYIRLLCHQWNRGGLDADEDRISRMAGAMPVPSLGYVLAKFLPCPDGKLRNIRLEMEREKQTAFRAQQAEKGKKGAEKRWNDSRSHNPAMPVPSPNHSSPSPSPSPVSILHSPSSNLQTIPHASHSGEALKLQPPESKPPKPKREPKPKAESTADARFKPFVAAYSDAYKARFNDSYPFHPKDGKALKEFLEAKPDSTVEQLMAVLADCWKYTMADIPFKKSAFAAATIHQFVTNYSAFVVECAKPS